MCSDGFGKVYDPLQLSDYIQQPEVVETEVKPVSEQPKEQPIIKVRVKVKEVEEEEDFEDESFDSEEDYSSETRLSNKREFEDDSDESSDNIKRRR